LSTADPLDPETSQDFSGDHLLGVPFGSYRMRS